MKNKRFLIFAVITIAFILAAGITANLRSPKTYTIKEILFPDLANRINEVVSIDIKGNKKSVLLWQQDGTWVLENQDNYPALFEKVKQTVINLSELKILSNKTDNPDFYAKLGVEDPGSGNSDSLLLTLKDKSDQEIATIIVGNPRHSKSASNKPGLYVRKPHDKQALLVEGFLDITTEMTDWFNRHMLDMPSSRIQEVWIRHPDGDELRIGKKNSAQPDFKLQDRSGSSKDKSIYKIFLNRIGRSLEELRADGVRTAKEFEFPPGKTIVTIIKTFDGMLITAKCLMIDNKPFAHFSFDTDELLINSRQEKTEKDAGDTDVREEARMLNDIMSEWIYQIPEFKFKDLTTRKDSITRKMKSGFGQGLKKPSNPLQNLDFPSPGQ